MENTIIDPGPLSVATTWGCGTAWRLVPFAFGAGDRYLDNLQPTQTGSIRTRRYVSLGEASPYVRF